jgi:hypothetical protein
MAQHKEPDVRTWIGDLRRRAAEFREKKPATKMGQIRAVWDDIEQAIANGQRPSEIQEWLAEMGLTVDTPTLRCYIRRIRKQQAVREQHRREQRALWPLAGTVAAERRANRPPEEDHVSETGPVTGQGPEGEAPFNPLEQAQRVLSRKRFDIREIHGDGDPKNKNLI